MVIQICYHVVVLLYMCILILIHDYIIILICWNADVVLVDFFCLSLLSSRMSCWLWGTGVFFNYFCLYCLYDDVTMWWYGYIITLLYNHIFVYKYNNVKMWQYYHSLIWKCSCMFFLGGLSMLRCCSMDGMKKNIGVLLYGSMFVF